LKITRDGCSLWTERESGSNQGFIITESGGTCELYGCELHAHFHFYWDFFLEGKFTAYNCLFVHVIFYAAAVDLYNCIWTEVRLRALYNTSGEFETLKFGGARRDGSILATMEFGGDRTFRNIWARGFDYLISRTLGIKVNFYLINWDVDVWAFSFGADKFIAWRQYEFDLAVTDKDGNPINGATVELKDKNGNVVFSVKTDVNGRITTQTVSRGWYEQATGNTLNDLSPHTLTISKAGYQDYVKKFTLEAKTNWEIKLAKAVGIFLSFGNPVINLKKSDPENKNVMAL